jgi:hypothetical protein
LESTSKAWYEKMNLIFHSHISSKTHRDFALKMFPDGEPDDFLKRNEEEEGDEMTAWTCEYDFPDNSVVLANVEFGPALVSPDGPVKVTIEVHIGPEASAPVIAAAEAEAKNLAVQEGIEVHDGSDDDSSLFRIIRH